MPADANHATSAGPIPLTLGVTAHRDPPDDEVTAIEAQLQALFEALEERYPDTPLRLISPLADGGDRIAARVARARGIELVVPLPLPLEEYEQDFEDPESRREFRDLLEAARVVDLPALAGADEIEHDRDGNRVQAYARVGVYTSDHCQILIAIWDGKPADSRGGTADVVDYHQFGRMTPRPFGDDDGYNYGHDDGSRGRRGLAPDDTDLVFHIVCSRDRADGAPADGLEPGTARWLVTDPERKEIPDIPIAQDLMLKRTGAFNRDQLDLPPDDALAERLPGWRDDLGGEADLARTATYFSRADRLAARFRRRYRTTLRLLYLLAALMGVAFIAYADLDRAEMIAAYLGLFFVGWVVYRIAARREWHRKFLDYRALAEGLRVQFYWRLAGVSGQLRNDFAYDNFLQKQDVEIGWIRNVMRYAGAPDAPASNREREVDAVIEHWIGQPGGRGQLGYFEDRCRTHRRHVRRTERLVTVTLWAGIGITVVLALFQQRLEDTLVTAMVAAMGILPLAAAVREAYAHKVAEKELLKQYRFMLTTYRTAQFRLARCESVEEKRGLLRALGEAALDEHAEWILIHRERPLEPGKL
ncbi:hypothetical protein [Halomonas denitrificans]|nr:hypothetical protein [Halomonas denitrificans]